MKYGIVIDNGEYVCNLNYHHKDIETLTDLSELNSKPTVTKLVINNCNEHYYGNWSSVFNALQNNVTITSLIFTWNSLDSVSIEALVNMIRINRTLKVLNLSRNRMKSNVEFILEAMKFNTTLQSLSLEGNSFKDQLQISEMLQKNTTLKELDISLNFPNISCIGSALKINKNLAILKIADIGVVLEDQELQNFTQGVASNKSLEILNFGGNAAKNIEFEIARWRCVLEDNTTLQELNLDRRPLNHSHLENLQQGLLNSKTMKKIDICSIKYPSCVMINSRFSST